MVLNWKVWEHYENGFEELSLIYNDLWKQADSDAINLFEGHSKELNYFLDATD